MASAVTPLLANLSLVLLSKDLTFLGANEFHISVFPDLVTLFKKKINRSSDIH
jgi:hypothetical protein